MTGSNKFRIAIRKFDPFESAIEKIWEAFCKESGCQLELDAVAMDLHPLYDTILKNNGLKNGDWDIAFINTDWITEAVENNHLENLSPFIKRYSPEKFPAGWAPSLLGMQEFDGSTYALPFHDGPECLIYRKDLFESEEEQSTFLEKYGKELSVPGTWDELKEVATFFHRPKQNLFGTVFAAYPDGHNTVFDFCLQLWTRGGELLTKDGHIVINSPQALEGMQYYRDMLQNTEVIHPDSREFDSVKSGMAFAEGQLAMMVNWFGFASMCEVHPDSKVKGKVEITNVPAGPTGKGVSLNAYWMYALGVGCKKKEVAYDFMRFAVNPANDKLMTMEGGIGCRKSTWHDPDVNTEVPYYHKLEELHQNARELPRMSNWSDIATIIDQLVLDVINTDKNIQKLLDNAQQQIDPIWKLNKTY
ncbi:sugar ABC transporter substrate-binding protein [Fulvivirga sp. M361]|uniref:ABC transporter substrate-binding protein n=1 Tax=Fulvivirga sp. M361 TaxID=2594266 RepID=UPI001179F258|nr:sugar ABC transporter substrate-binding protein [Fulvivirga sp. M361]TRX57619.1 sugar ABC transporter substrate-binding protein [Fulvivirga sp. M361]